MIITALHYLRSKLPDRKNPVDNISDLFDDDFYETILTRAGVNPNSFWQVTPESVYRQLHIEVLYSVLNDYSKIRKMEELGVVSGELDIERKINHLKFRDTAFEWQVFRGPQIP